MDFSNLFSGQENKKNFENKVGTQGEDLISKMLPLLSGGKMDTNDLIKILASGNPRVSNLMQFMPLLSSGFGSKQKQTSLKKNYDYVKISDYYKNK